MKGPRNPEYVKAFDCLNHYQLWNIVDKMSFRTVNKMSVQLPGVCCKNLKEASGKDVCCYKAVFTSTRKAKGAVDYHRCDKMNNSDTQMTRHCFALVGMN